MTDIPNTEYITVNANGIFVGGKPATRYCGQQIVWDDDDRDAQTYFLHMSRDKIKMLQNCMYYHLKHMENMPNLVIHHKNPVETHGVV